MINRDKFLTELKEEKRFRKVLRNLLEGYLKEKKQTQKLEEQRFRKIIRALIKENVSAGVADEQPQRSTGINVLETLLKNIIPTVEDEDKFIPIRDQDQEPDPEEEEEPESFKPIAGMNLTGRNFATLTFNKIENQILDSYESLGDKEDRTTFEDYLLTNLKLYFDRFEEELQPSLTEPESPDYEPKSDLEGSKEETTDLGL